MPGAGIVRAVTGPPSPASVRPLVACLLPVRNGERDLPGWLASVRRFADVVVALDDGSTDRTFELLDADPLVRTRAPEPAARRVRGVGRRGEPAAAARGVRRAPAGLGRVARRRRAARRRGRAGAAARSWRRTRSRGARTGSSTTGCGGAASATPSRRTCGGRSRGSAGLTLPTERLHFDPVPVSRSRGRRGSRRRSGFGTWRRPTSARRVGPAAEYAEADPGAGVPDELRRARRRAGDDRSVAASARPRLPALVPTAELERTRDLFADRATPRPAAARRPAAGSGRRTRPARVVRLGAAVRRCGGCARRRQHGRDARACSRPNRWSGCCWRARPREGHAGWDDAREPPGAARGRAARSGPGGCCSSTPTSASTRGRGGAAGVARPRGGRGGPRVRVPGPPDDRGPGVVGPGRAVGVPAVRVAAGAQLPAGRLHAVPVPAEIPPERYVRTTVRIQHLGGATEERRRERYRKYREADPGRRLAGRLRGAARAPAGAAPVGAATRPGLPVVAAAPPDEGRRWRWRGLPPAEAEDVGLAEAPALSAVVIARDDEDRIERVVRSVVDQEMPEPFEVIVVVSGTDRTAEIVHGGVPGGDPRAARPPGAARRGAERRPGGRPRRLRVVPRLARRAAAREPGRPAAGAPAGVTRWSPAPR